MPIVKKPKNLQIYKIPIKWNNPFLLKSSKNSKILPFLIKIPQKTNKKII